MTYLRNLFISGLIVFLPVFATIYFLALILRWADGWFAPLVYKYLPLPYIPGLSLMFTVIIILFTGLLAQNLIGQRLIEYGEMLIYRLPLTKGIYTTVKQMMEALIHPGQGGFKKVALVEYPRKGVYSMGLVTGESRGELRRHFGEQTMLHVFIPTSPNPTTGFFIIVPEEEVVILDMPIDVAMRMIISGGMAQEREEIGFRTVLNETEPVMAPPHAPLEEANK